ncbi:armadillo repeat-containing protein 7-like [Macadamia integrifolia]|uniref:armadillo repeat-containing protein 7-like n=1 Tax=Macadamia integrifolia TaxID=60698 RepID=UPI001C4F4320|nr:armadillo repeat-containing protein 7-like [Macadamia integrifolia]XP_042515932.1 armadillo repeat-containing protein 7-like [Macadamia integrifolia]
MFTNNRRQVERTGKYGTPRLQYLQELVSQFQNTTDEDQANAAIITQCGGIPLMMQCLSSPVRNHVNYALGTLYYLCDASHKEEILKPEVVETIKRYAATGVLSVSFSNLAKAFLDKHVPE